MKILSAEFVTGAVRPAQFPASVLPEVAFAGKSNVGKSSLINTLLNRKHLVKTSSTPGKTREINFFRINGTFLFVDLPGYGYAEAPKEVQRGWQALLEGYLTGRAPLRGVILIVDSRHPPSPLDAQLKAFLKSHGVAVTIVASKIDKVSRSQVSAHLSTISANLELAEPPIPFSSKTGEGMDAVWTQLNEWVRSPAKPQQS